MTLLLSLLAAPAQAQLMNQTICVRHQTDFLDADPTVGDDLYTNNDPKDAIGIRVQLLQGSPTGPVVLDRYAGSDGCFQQLLNAGTFHAKLISEYDVDGRIVSVETPVGANYAVISGAWTAADNTKTFTLDGTAMSWVSVAAAATYTVHRRSSDWPLETYKVRLSTVPGAGVTGLDPTTGIVHIDPTSDKMRRKFTIAHEMGHALQFFANDTQLYPFNMDYNAPIDSICDFTGGHWINSKEYQSAALMEGFANYVSAVVFNHTVGTLDCRRVPPGTVDWDNDGNLSSAAYSCEGAEGNDPGGIEASYGVNPRDYLGQYCLTPGSGGGTPAEFNRATELDWERMFWDIDTDYSTGFGELLEIWVGAGPGDWIIDDGDSGSDPDDFPSKRMADSALDFGIGFYIGAWDPEDGPQGVDR
jgi:hypothetical protein